MTSVMPVHCPCGVVIVSIIGVVGCGHGRGRRQHQRRLQSYLRETTVGVWCQEEINLNGKPLYATYKYQWEDAMPMFAHHMDMRSYIRDE
jgi:hypothetical protein